MAATHFSIVLLALAFSVVSAQISGAAGKCCSNVAKISVTGVGNIEYKANIAVVRLGVTLSGKSPGSVQALLAKRSARLVAFLRRNNVQKLQTTGVSLNPQRNYSVSPPKVIGYSGSNTVSFEVLATAAGKILDGAVKNSASNINSVSFKGSPAVVFAARRSALRQATIRAQQEARIVVLALGKRLGGPLSVRINAFFSAPATQARPIRRSAASSKALASTPVVSGTRSVRATVNIDFKIY